ncbi:hypothetical protein KBB68_03830 [Candidatus Babeliales bacterium]|nr:hypothetical protein [Candidatus Babeliales bacterium]
MKFYRIIFISIFAFLSSFSSIQSSTCPEFITIYVHGTTTKLGLRLLSNFYKDMAFGEPGIHHFDELPDVALLRKDAQILQSGDACRFNANHFYTFGWSGSLSFKAREKAGRELYDGVCALLKDYEKKYGKMPKVRILTFSHGGNVALNMVKLLPFFDEKSVYLELILVAVPVQKVTEKLIESPFVSQSYIISSSRDLMQVVDCYKYEKKRYVPKRFFDTTSQNCRQIKVTINNRGLGHIDLMRSFMLHLPDALNFADQACKQSKTLIEIFDQNSDQADICDILEYKICDSEFRFYNVLNLQKAVRGQRKKHYKKIKQIKA